MNKDKANYGVDAPNVLKNLFFLSLSFLIIAIFSFQIHSRLWFWFVFLYSFLTFFTLFATGCWMLYGIKIAKPKIVSQMIRQIKLTGNEKVLDLGCGRGLLVCEVAKQLLYGEVHGIDLWSKKDQSGNKPEKTLENAKKEGVLEKVTIHTGDIRSLRFANQSFDVVVSSLCLHNIKDKNEREKALQEMLRILKVGGKFAIADIQYGKQYQEFLTTKGARIEYTKKCYSYCPPITILIGKINDSPIL